MKLNKSIAIVSFFFFISLHAELLILKNTEQGLAALTHEESLHYGPTISQIILKYQWPMCIMSNLTKEEKDELLTPKIPNAEAIFIQKKLQQVIPELDIQVAFISTTLYELFCLLSYFDKSVQVARAIKSSTIDYRLNPLQRIGLAITSDLKIKS